MRVLAAFLALAACATADPFTDLVGAQRRLDERGIAFGITRVPGHDAFVLRLRFTTSDSVALEADPRLAATAAAPPGCTVADISAQPDGAYRVDYAC